MFLFSGGLENFRGMQIEFRNGVIYFYGPRARHVCVCVCVVKKKRAGGREMNFFVRERDMGYIKGDERYICVIYLSWICVSR